MLKIPHSQIKPVREARWAAAGRKCELCGLPMSITDIVLDHCHKRGWVRGSLHRRCNSLLGKIENNAPRFGFANDGYLYAFLHGVAGYLQRNTTCHTGMIHPLHKTEDEKRIAKNLKARNKRAAAKKA
ncbi:endonuclease [Brevundimonas phage AA]|mgnify:CR=1 FL=1|uniref:Endonuclease n=1 Tax=Brevundimonas phage AA TaxID=2880937 RepID=A0AAN0KEI1_9CAUD|nr:endonuclease [Brevundimonas phage BC]UCR90877.1 endonuclease [Brevundimonas phage AA]